MGLDIGWDYSSQLLGAPGFIRTTSAERLCSPAATAAAAATQLPQTAPQLGFPTSLFSFLEAAKAAPGHKKSLRGAGSAGV